MATKETPNVAEADPAEMRAFMVERAKKDERKKAVGNEIGEQVSAFVEKTGVNKTALSFAVRLGKLSPEKRADVLRSLDMIRDHMAPVWSQTEEMDFEAA